MILYCEGPECDRETLEGRPYCWGHMKQYQRGKRLTPIAEKLTPMDKFLDACAALGRVGTDEDDDADADRLTKAALQAARPLVGGEPSPEVLAKAVREARSAPIREGLERARARGVRLGRPPRVTAEDAARVVQELGGTRKAARTLGISRNAVRRAMRRSPVHGSGNNHSEPTEGAAP